jgi:N6-adenosine-specific RNA methylase IME4
MVAWGFTYKTIFLNWIKINQGDRRPICGLGSYTRSSCELCLLGVSGPSVMPLKRSNTVQQTVHAVRGPHSQKPIKARRRIEKFFGIGEAGEGSPTCIELFAREQAPHWVAWGNEIPQ